MKTRMTQVRANVSDLQRAVEWYEKVLGFECAFTDINERWQYAQFACGEGAVFSVMAADTAGACARFNFRTDDVDSLWESLKDRVTVIEPIETMPYGSRKFTIADPDGNELGFVEEGYAGSSAKKET